MTARGDQQWSGVTILELEMAVDAVLGAAYPPVTRPEEESAFVVEQRRMRGELERSGYVRIG